MIMGDAPRRQTHLFTVRVWLEDLGEGKTEWRGKVTHVASGEVRYFRGWSRLARQLREMLPDDMGVSRNGTVPA
jgi:hypothetical protein